MGLVLFGLIMLSSASGPTGYENFGDSYYFVKHQILFGLIPGLIGLLWFARTPCQQIKRYAFSVVACFYFALVGCVHSGGWIWVFE